MHPFKKFQRMFNFLHTKYASAPLFFFQPNPFEAGTTFGNSFFDNCFGFLRQCKDRSFLGTFTVHKKVEVRINRSQILPVLVRLILTSTKKTSSELIELKQGGFDFD
jgi:hypothetical protein